MGSPGEHIDRIEAIRSLMDRLCAPDLTLAEAKDLRPNLSHLLNGAHSDVDPVRSPSARHVGLGQDR